MRVCLINQYFWPDRAATAQLLADLAEDLARAGWQVTALAGRGSYAPGREGPLAGREHWRGVEIVRVPCTDLGRGSTLRRVLDYATYFVSAALRVLAGPRYDILVCLSTPPLLAAIGLLARLRGARFVYKVEDLYPDVAVALGQIAPNSVLARGLRRLSNTLLRRAEACVALDEAMAGVLQSRGARRVELIPNWADGVSIHPDPEAGGRFRQEHGLADRFVALYSGNLGLAHRFDAVLMAARRLEHEAPRVLLLFVGDGPRLFQTRQQATGLGNVRFLPYQAREALGGLYNAADLHLVTLRDEVAGLLVPSKYAAALAAGRPVLAVGGCQAFGKEVETEGVGWCRPHDAAPLVELLRELSTSPQALASRGIRARALYEARYDRVQATRRWQELLEDVVARSRREVPPAG